jgi:hypothetical protein
MTAKPRKTIEVAPLIDRINLLLELSFRRQEDASNRKVLAHLAETILFDGDNYRGFSFTDEANGRTDETARFYYGPRSNIDGAYRARGIKDVREAAASIIKDDERTARVLAEYAAENQQRQAALAALASGEAKLVLNIDGDALAALVNDEPEASA